MNFDLDVFTLKKLIFEIDQTLDFFIEVECTSSCHALGILIMIIGNIQKSDVVNYEDVKRRVLERLNQLLEVGKREGIEGAWPGTDANGKLLPPAGTDPFHVSI